MFRALKRGFRSMTSLILVRNVVGELRPKRTLAASRGFLAAARLSCIKSQQKTSKEGFIGIFARAMSCCACIADWRNMSALLFCFMSKRRNIP